MRKGVNKNDLHFWTIKSSNFGFYTLNDKLIQQFREDGEIYLMSREDK